MATEEEQLDHAVDLVVDAPPKGRGRRQQPPQPPEPTEEERAAEELVRDIIGGPTTDDPPLEEIDQFIAGQVLAAESPDRALTPLVRVRARDQVGKRLVLLEYRLVETPLEDRMARYALMVMGDQETGEELVVTSGARHIMAQLAALDRQGVLPLEVVFEHTPRDIEPTDYRIWLRALPAPPA